MYMFNFRSESHYIPGASDLLLSAVMQQAIAEGKNISTWGWASIRGSRSLKRSGEASPFSPMLFAYTIRHEKGLWRCSSKDYEVIKS